MESSEFLTTRQNGQFEIFQFFMEFSSNLLLRSPIQYLNLLSHLIRSLRPPEGNSVEIVREQSNIQDDFPGLKRPHIRLGRPTDRV
jgi:hypothetical protein